MIKLVSVDQLKPGMYVHDLNCGWLEHNFVRSRFALKDEATLTKIRATGVHEVYIDTERGLDVANAPSAEEAQQEIDHQIEQIAESRQEPIKPTPLAEELQRARGLARDANRIVRNMLDDIRLGQQIEVDKVEPLVEKMVDSIFRHPDALTPLLRLKNHDDYTFLHSVSVCTLLVNFARTLGFDRELIKQIAIGGLLHDVGKAQVPDEILNKPGKLTDAEFDRMKNHVVQSKILLQNTEGISQVALDVAAQHHERFDGTGYPNKYKEDEISLYGQMGAIVDVYDALSSNRVYHKGMPPTEALRKLLEWSKFHFNPNLVQSFIRSIGIYPVGSLVRLHSGRLAVVIEQTPEKLLMPRVKVIYHAQHRHYLPPDEIDLESGNDRIVGGEDYVKWGIDETRWVAAT